MVPDDLKTLFPNAKFQPPASSEAIAAAEAALGLTLPEQLRALYRECNGFREDKGNAKYLLSLLEDDHIGSLVTITKFFWTEFRIPLRAVRTARGLIRRRSAMKTVPGRSSFSKQRQECSDDREGRVVKIFRREQKRWEISSWLGATVRFLSARSVLRRGRSTVFRRRRAEASR